MSKCLGQAILIVEDEWLIADALNDTLVDAGFSVVGPAKRVSDALTLIGNTHIDAALLDVSLGDEKSFPIAQELKGRNVPFVFMSGYSRKDFPDEFRGCHLLLKPVAPLTIINCISSLLA